MMDKCFDEGVLQAFLDNELDADLASRVARHVGECDACAIALAEVEEETAIAFEALGREFDTLVPTERLWTKINDQIAEQNRGFGARLRGWLAALSLTPVRVGAFATLLLVAGIVFSRFGGGDVPIDSVAEVKTTPAVVVRENPPVVVTKNDNDGTGDIFAEPDSARQPGPRVRYVRTAFKPESRIKRPESKTETVAPVPERAIDGEDGYVETIARLEKTVNSSKDEVLRPSARFAYEKDLAVVDDAITKMRKEVKTNPKNSDARELLFASYKNKIELLSSVSRQGDLMATLR